MKKFLLVDDHVLVRSGVQSILSVIYKGCEIDEASEGDGATELLKKNQYDVIIMDVKMPKTDTLGLMEYIHIRYPDAKVLILSMSSENVYAKRFLKVGARGFISKDAPIEDFKKALELILNGRKYISESMAVFLAEQSYSETSSNPFDKLSAREFEILYLLISGQTVSDIAKSLNVQVSTVGTHKSRLFEKLGVENLLELKELSDAYNL